MKNNKKTAVYIRTRTNNTSWDIQLEAAKPYLEGIYDTDILYFSDLNVQRSSKREGLDTLLESISRDEVGTLVVFSRDRLSRQINEYSKILKLIYAHNVNVIFSAKAQPPFNHDVQSGILSEVRFAIITEFESKIMSDRVKAALKRKAYLKDVH